jgi:hypothetical protein
LVTDLYLGWDVGGWNCDDNPKSRDALCALTMRGADLEVVGSPWRGNLRADLVNLTGTALIKQLLERVGISDVDHHVTIAIDTPLAWPTNMIKLMTDGATISVPEHVDNNPYLFRAQERALFVKRRGPLSVVRDMIGSQSTKGIHFLRVAGLEAAGAGVWASRDPSVVAIETYPARVGKTREAGSSIKRLLADAVRADGRANRKSRNDWWKGDVGDAIACAIVASLHHSRRGLTAPAADADGDEGWIWLPA